MTVLITAIHILVCLVLILVILLQAGRGAGLSWGSFGGDPQSVFGTKSATFLKKATTVSAILFLLTCIGLNIIETHKSKSLFSTGNTQVDIEKIKQALEQVKAEEAKNPQTATPAAGATTETPAAETKSEN